MDRFDKLMKANFSSPVILTFFLNGKEIGRLVIKDNKLEFVGDADISAKILFDKLKPLIDDYIKEKTVSLN